MKRKTFGQLIQNGIYIYIGTFRNISIKIIKKCTGGPLIVWKMGPGETPHYANPHYVRHYVMV